MQDKWQLFQKFLITQNAEISVPDFLINSAIVVVLSLILQWTYFKCGKSLSNRIISSIEIFLFFALSFTR